MRRTSRRRPVGGCAPLLRRPVRRQGRAALGTSGAPAPRTAAHRPCRRRGAPASDPGPSRSGSRCPCSRRPAPCAAAASRRACALPSRHAPSPRQRPQRHHDDTPPGPLRPRQQRRAVGNRPSTTVRTTLARGSNTLAHDPGDRSKWGQRSWLGPSASAGCRREVPGSASDPSTSLPEVRHGQRQQAQGRSARLPGPLPRPDGRAAGPPVRPQGRRGPVRRQRRDGQNARVLRRPEGRPHDAAGLRRHMAQCTDLRPIHAGGRRAPVAAARLPDPRDDRAGGAATVAGAGVAARPAADAGAPLRPGHPRQPVRGARGCRRRRAHRPQPVPGVVGEAACGASRQGPAVDAGAGRRRPAHAAASLPRDGHARRRFAGCGRARSSGWRSRTWTSCAAWCTSAGR
jgi:hypothetical protein